MGDGCLGKADDVDAYGCSSDRGELGGRGHRSVRSQVNRHCVGIPRASDGVALAPHM